MAITTPYNVKTSGIIRITGHASIGFYVYVNGIEVGRGGGEGGNSTSQDTVYAPVSIGDNVIFSYNTNYGGYSFMFFPYRLL